MKKIILTIVCIILCIFFIFAGCIDESDKNKQNNTENGSNITNPNDTNDIDNNTLFLQTISLNQTDLLKQMENLFYNHTQEPYYVENLTGNNMRWQILEGVFSSFACNTSRLHQSILRFNSSESATMNIQLNKQNLINQNFSPIEMNQIGNSSFLMHSTKPFNDGDIDVWILHFAIDDIVVSLQGYAEKKDDMITYANMIKQRISDNESF